MSIFQVATRTGKEDEFARFFHETAIPLMRVTKGIVQVLSVRHTQTHENEFSFVMVLESLEALKTFAGEDYCNLAEPAV